MTIEKAILKRVRALPPETQEEVLKYAESLTVPRQKSLCAIQQGGGLASIS
jgi:hypothetical protein